jgi:hypothetical protein
VGALRWQAVGLGFLLAVSLVLLLGRLVAFGAPALGIVYQFLALFVGAFVAGKLAGRAGLAQGLAVAVLYVIGVATLGVWADYDAVNRFGPAALGPLNLGDLVIGDLVTLTAGALGGYAATGRSA